MIEWLFTHTQTVAALALVFLIGMAIGHWQEFKETSDD